MSKEKQAKNNCACDRTAAIASLQLYGSSHVGGLFATSTGTLVCFCTSRANRATDNPAEPFSLAVTDKDQVNLFLSRNLQNFVTRMTSPYLGNNIYGTAVFKLTFIKFSILSAFASRASYILSLAKTPLKWSFRIAEHVDHQDRLPFFKHEAESVCSAFVTEL